MSRATVTRRLYQFLITQQSSSGQPMATPVAAAAAPAAPAAASITGATATGRKRGFANNSHHTLPPPREESPPSAVEAKAEVEARGKAPAQATPPPNDQEEVAQDEAAAKRALLLKRYGDRTPPSGPIPVKIDPHKGKAGEKPGAFDVEKAAATEVNHNEIWADYVSYMEHQRKKGWKT